MNSPNTNIDDIFEEFEKDYQEGSGSMAFAKASIKAKTKLEALISAAKKEVLETIARNEGWEDSRDFYAAQFGIPYKYVDKWHKAFKEQQ
jgi:hypothetical protein